MTSFTEIPSPDDVSASGLASEAQTQQPAATVERPGLLRRFRRQPIAMGAACFLVVLAVLAALAPVLSPFDPRTQDLARAFEGPSAEHWLGTDDLGRDLLSRLLYGARLSLLASLQAVLVGIVLGVPTGILAGWWRGWFDTLLSRIADGMMSFPPLILAIAIVGVLGPNLTNAMLAIGLVYAPRFFRLVRGATLVVAQETYIEASRSIGTPAPTIIWRHILPNIATPLIVLLSLSCGLGMLAESSLSFIGLGVQPPDASWGAMLAQASRFLERDPWLMVYPGLLISLSVLAFNLIGEGLRDSLGRESRGRAH
jgi:ABC-type dipeptide/oligopeptide/nickel transport system permease subunit